MKYEINRHARDFRGEFTLEFDVKNPSLPEEISQEFYEFEAETGIVSCTHAQDCFNEIKRKLKYNWIKDWSFAGRSGGWFALICEGKDPDKIRESQINKIASIVDKYEKSYGQELLKTYNNI